MLQATHQHEFSFFYSKGNQWVNRILVKLLCVQWHNNPSTLQCVANTHLPFTSCAQATVQFCSLLASSRLSTKCIHISMKTHTVKSLGTSQRTASAWVGPRWRGGDLTAVWSRICQPLTVCQTGQKPACTDAHRVVKPSWSHDWL